MCEEIKAYVADFREFLQKGPFPERKALIRNFVQGIEIVDNEATLTYTIPMPQDGITRESAPVLEFVQSGPPSSWAGYPWRHLTNAPAGLLFSSPWPDDWYSQHAPVILLSPCLVPSFPHKRESGTPLPIAAFAAASLYEILRMRE